MRIYYAKDRNVEVDTQKNFEKLPRDSRKVPEAEVKNKVVKLLFEGTSEF